MNEHHPSTLWPTYAFRAWLTALLAETRRSRLELDARIEHYEKAIAHLLKQKERSEKVVESLSESIGIVDGVLRHVRDTGADVRSEEDTTQATEKIKESGGHPNQLEEHPADAKKQPHEKRPR